MCLRLALPQFLGASIVRGTLPCAVKVVRPVGRSTVDGLAFSRTQRDQPRDCSSSSTSQNFRFLLIICNPMEQTLKPVHARDANNSAIRASRQHAARNPRERKPSYLSQALDELVERDFDGDQTAETIGRFFK